MRFRRGTSVITGIVFIGLLAANLICWQPRVGGDFNMAFQAFSRDYGWLSTYQKETWEPNDSIVGSRRPSASLFFIPHWTMRRVVRNFGLPPLAFDAVFGGTLLALTALVAEGFLRRRITLLTNMVVIGLFGILFSLFKNSDSLSIHPW